MNRITVKAVVISLLAGIYLAMEKVHSSVRPVEAEFFLSWVVMYGSISFVVTATWLELRRFFEDSFQKIVFWYLMFVLFPLNSALFTEIVVNWIQALKPEAL